MMKYNPRPNVILEGRCLGPIGGRTLQSSRKALEKAIIEAGSEGIRVEGVLAVPAPKKC